MALVIVWTAPDGRLRVEAPALPRLGGEGDAAYAARVAAKVVPAGLPWRAVDPATLPPPTDHPDDWKDSGTAVTVDATLTATRENNQTNAMRAAAVSLLNDRAATPKALKGVLLALLDRLNAIGAQHNALLTWLGGQTTLTNRAQLGGLTLTANAGVDDAKAFVAAKINAGPAD